MSNKSAKERLIKLYGPECFIEKLKLRDTTGLKYTGKKQYKIMKQLTYHHILEKSKGGRATIENGALLSNENHIWFHRQSKENQAKMNAMFRAYKECKVIIDNDIPLDYIVNAMEFEIQRKRSIDIEKQRRNEKKEMQRLKKEYEDR